MESRRQQRLSITDNNGLPTPTACRAVSGMGTRMEEGVYGAPIDCHINFDANRDADHDFVIFHSWSFLWVRAVDARDEREVRSRRRPNARRF